MVNSIFPPPPQMNHFGEDFSHCIRFGGLVEAIPSHVANPRSREWRPLAASLINSTTPERDICSKADD
jgi:hypothetical protein